MRSYIDLLKNKSQEEINLSSEIESLTTDFEESDLYKEYHEKLKALYAKMDEAFNKRMKEYRETNPSRRKITSKPIDMEKFREENRKEHEKWFNSLPSNVKETVLTVTNMTEGERDLFNKALYKEDFGKKKESQYSNPKTEKEDTWDLQRLLVQTTIDFLNERKLDDVDVISFSADGLSASVKEGEWTCSTDSSIELMGYQQDEEDKYPSRKLIQHLNI